MNPVTLEKIIDIGREMAETRNLEPLLNYAMQVAIELLDAQYGYLVMVENDGQLKFRVCRDKAGNDISVPDEQISHTIFNQVISTREPLIIADAIVDPNYQNADSVLSLQLRSVMCVPLVTRERVVGAIYVENRTQTALFDETSLKPLTYLAAQAAVSIENVLLYEELETRVQSRTQELVMANEKLHTLAITDPLTGAYNRRHFFDLAHAAVKYLERYHHDLSVIMIDVDHFKQVNDQFGHMVGDAVLIAFVNILKESVRDADIVARYGGEEFVIMMPETDLHAAANLAQRLCVIVNDHEFVVGEHKVHITISLGVSSMDGTEKDRSVDTLVEHADEALYNAKNSGRNSVATWSPGGGI